MGVILKLEDSILEHMHLVPEISILSQWHCFIMRVKRSLAEVRCPKLSSEKAGCAVGFTLKLIWKRLGYRKQPRCSVSLDILWKGLCSVMLVFSSNNFSLWLDWTAVCEILIICTAWRRHVMGMHYTHVMHITRKLLLTYDVLFFSSFIWFRCIKLV